MIEQLNEPEWPTQLSLDRVEIRRQRSELELLQFKYHKLVDAVCFMLNEADITCMRSREDIPQGMCPCPVCQLDALL